MTHVLSLECSTLTHINCYHSLLLLLFYCTVALSDVAICQLLYEYTYRRNCCISNALSKQFNIGVTRQSH